MLRFRVRSTGSSQSICNFFGRLVLVNGLAMECPYLGRFSSLMLSYECRRSILFVSPSSSLLYVILVTVSPVALSTGVHCCSMLYGRVLGCSHCSLVWHIDAPCNRLLCFHGKMIWVQGLAKRSRCLSVQTSIQLLHVLCLRTNVRFRGFVHYSGGTLRPVPNPVIRLPCWYVLMGVPSCIGENVSSC